MWMNVDRRRRASDNGTTVLEPPLSLDWPVLPEPAQGRMTKMDRSLKITFLKGKFSSGREGALASKFNYDFK